MKTYQQCKRCIMDNENDDFITFNMDGICNYCETEMKRMSKVYFPNANGKKLFEDQIIMIKKAGEGKEYDCLMGISGGLDSSYLAFLGFKYGLRILGVHIDDGFDTDVCKSNINKLFDKCKFKLINITPDEKQYNELLRAYILAEVPNLAVLQDNLINTYLLLLAKKYKIKYFLSGGNFATESILQKGNTYSAYDVVNIKSINKNFGRESIDKLPLMSLIKKKLVLEKILNISNIRLLNYVDYNREKAFSELFNFCEYENYGAKHTENYFTIFLQLYWLPRKFGVDKRKSHYSSLIISNQMTREKALQEINKPLIEDKDFYFLDFVSKKLDLTKEEIEIIVKRKGNQHEDYKTSLITKMLIKLVNNRESKIRKNN
ncbi:MAG: N-acetyl sugar amidotransferase [Bacilli bacterium]